MERFIVQFGKESYLWKNFFMFLNQPLTSLSGIGNKRRPLFERLLGMRIVDALMHLPCDLIKRRLVQKITQAQAGEIISVIAEIVSHTPPSYFKKPYIISCSDGQTLFDLTFFNGKAAHLKTILPVQQKRLISGKLEKFQGHWKIIHPDYILKPEEAFQLTQSEPVYPLTTGITNKCVNRVIKSALLQVPSLPEWLDEQKAKIWPNWSEAIQQVHNPQTSDDLLPQLPARLRLAYDELLAYQLSLNLTRNQAHTKTKGISLNGNDSLSRKIYEALPFSLTPGQQAALEDIKRDMASSDQMLRLLQGDVGSGKTIVSFLAMIQAVEAGFQAAILAPTDILARQHLAKLSPLCEKAHINITLLTGRDQGKKRAQILEDLSHHRIHILIGTHAILQEDVQFAQFGLGIVDEQHRFGVEQRLMLMNKGENPDLLVMTATPIPRTLMLAQYGDMDVSLIRDKPKGRQTIDTKVLPLSRLEDVILGIGRALETGVKVYWVCPLIEESEAMDLAAALERWQELVSRYPGKIGLVHGKLKPSEKDAIMEQFIDGSIDVLVATTVIEVGIDVLSASIMVIEHAERFGLAQLHQLRGRIGRGNQEATCLLLYAPSLTAIGRKRLEVMRQTNDGFLIAEEDLKLRGSGELLGTKQSGLPRFRIADFTNYPDLYGQLFEMANKDARYICETDPTLSTPRGQALRVLLSLQGRNEAFRYSRSG